MRSTALPIRGRKCGSINPALRGTLRTGAAGLLLGLAFLPLPLGFLAWFAFVPLPLLGAAVMIYKLVSGTGGG